MKLSRAERIVRIASFLLPGALLIVPMGMASRALACGAAGLIVGATVRQRSASGPRSAVPLRGKSGAAGCVWGMVLGSASIGLVMILNADLLAPPVGTGALFAVYGYLYVVYSLVYGSSSMVAWGLALLRS